ncbi:MAG: hypothetical protein JWL73_1440 [Actinomycetia bacterium]|nr:hypothetical protein [Actinomycetes bacterium]
MVAVWHRGTYGEWPFADSPRQVHYCGRVYLAPNPTPGSVSGPLYYAFRFSPALAPSRDVYSATPIPEPRAPHQVCSMSLWMRVGSEYVHYELSGGP